MQPYQRATEEVRRQGELPITIGKKAASLAGTAASAYFGGAAATRVLSLVNKFVPEELSIKALSKVDPRYGKFIKKALNAGQSFDEVRDFITKKAEEGLQKEAPKKEEPASKESTIRKAVERNRNPSFTQRESERFNNVYGGQEQGSTGFKEAFDTMKGGTTTNRLYEGIFDALQKGKSTFAGVKDPLIQKAKPFFERGMIKSVQDLKDFDQQQRSHGEQMGQQPQQTQNPQMRQDLQNALQTLAQILRS